jgi:predicted ester cyclase
MDLAENKALVRRYYDEVLTDRDRDLLTQLLAPSFVSHVPGGPDVYTAAVQATYAAFPALAVTIHDQVAEADKVVTRWSASGTPTSQECLPPAATSR